MAFAVKKIISECDSGAKWSDGRPEFTDPVQGACNNCSFIAALTSVAWVVDKGIGYPITPTDPTPGDPMRYFSVPFPNRTPVKVSEELSLDCSTSPISFKFARSSEWAAAKEVWPCLYEKAYAKEFLQFDVTGTGCGNLHTALWPGNALPPLQHLSCYTTRSADYDPVFSDIKNLCSAPTANDPNKKTKYPMAIWTLTGSAWNKDQMIPDHTYSVLGTKGDYLVLRNPTGIIRATGGTYTNNNVLISGTWVLNNNFSYQCPGRTVNPGGKSTINLGEAGVFAIHKDKLSTYFKKYGYAT
jgi:hypothetical protein